MSEGTTRGPDGFEPQNDRPFHPSFRVRTRLLLSGRGGHPPPGWGWLAGLLPTPLGGGLTGFFKVIDWIFCQTSLPWGGGIRAADPGPELTSHVISPHGAQAPHTSGSVHEEFDPCLLFSKHFCMTPVISISLPTTRTVCAMATPKHIDGSHSPWGLPLAAPPRLRRRLHGGVGAGPHAWQRGVHPRMASLPREADHFLGFPFLRHEKSQKNTKS